ncbi:MAG: hypothetical protein HN348_08245, partial [Proteobacteria bacterium]|nr:hypothetical protein [Pseudomonadota bacterium]
MNFLVLGALLAPAWAADVQCLNPGDSLQDAYNQAAEEAGIVGSVEGGVICLNAGDFGEEELRLNREISIVFRGAGGRVSDQWMGQESVFRGKVFVELGSKVSFEDMTFIGQGSRNFYISSTANEVVFSGLGILQDIMPEETGAAVKIDGSAGQTSLTIDGSYFYENSAGVLNGGHIWVSHADLTVSNTTFSGGKAHKGGAVYLEENVGASFENVVFSLNDTGDDGGAIYVKSADVELGLVDVEFSQNTADGHGGAIFIKDTSGVIIEGGKFKLNEAVGNGGAIYVKDYLQQDIIVDPYQVPAGPGPGPGPHPIEDHLQLTLNGVGFASNEAVEGGAVFVNSGRVDVALGSEFKSNKASDGGAIGSGNGTLYVKNSAFQNNQASGLGGAILCDNTTICAIYDSTFTKNEADIGAGVAFDGVSNAEARRNLFCQNAVAQADTGRWGFGGSHGGGISFVDSVGDVSNNVFFENFGGDWGGAVAAIVSDTSTRLELFHNHFVGNNAFGQGSALYVSGADVSNMNNLFYKNVNGGSAIFLASGTSLSNYNLFFDNTPADTNTEEGENSIFEDPKLRNYLADDCTLSNLYPLYISPLVDAGYTPDYDARDLDGSQSDIGAWGGPEADPNAWFDGEGDLWPLLFDCNDENGAINPGVPEICDLLDTDEDCNNLADDDDPGVSDAVTYYFDGDGDDFGGDTSVMTCDIVSDDYVLVTGDCNDLDSLINPDAEEGIGDEVDQDCDGQEICYLDEDGDGFVVDTLANKNSDDVDCDDEDEAASDQLFPPNDCLDTNAAVNPDQVEVCDDANLDEDCNGLADDADPYVTDASSWYFDGDGDGYGAGSDVVQCEPPDVGWVEFDGDCNDANDTVNPGATELAGDEVDQNCDGDELCYVDGDNDGFIVDTLETVDSLGDISCDDAGEATVDQIAPTNDCDDSREDINPGATEIAGDETDQDCDGDEICFVDTDNDGFIIDTLEEVLSSGNVSCEDSGEAKLSELGNINDCDDGDFDIKPGVQEVAGDEVDQNCDTNEECYKDTDDDGFVDDSMVTVLSLGDLSCDDTGEALDDEVAALNDCNDNVF